MANSNEKQGAPVTEQTLNKQEAFLIKYKNTAIIAVVAILVVVCGWIGYNHFYAGPREAKASTALAKATDLYMQGNFEKALKGDKGVEGFIAVAENYGSTDAANLAKLYAGLSYAQLNKWQEAVNYLEDFSTKGDANISPASQAALGDAYANIKQIDKAISSFKKAADMADSKAEDGVNNSLSPIYLIKAARLLESQNKNDEALKIYQDIKSKYVNSAASQDIDKYIERLSK